jgi:hypothetical protein
MARFYINFRKGDLLVIDDEGIELPNIEAARDWAIASARDLVSEAIKYNGDITVQAVVITDEDGQEVMTIVMRDVLPASLRG